MEWCRGKVATAAGTGNAVGAIEKRRSGKVPGCRQTRMSQ